MATPQSHFRFLAFSLSIIHISLFLSTTATQQPLLEEQDTPITHFQRYLRINTAHPTPDYTSAVSFLKAQAQSLGLKTQTLEFFVESEEFNGLNVGFALDEGQASPGDEFRVFYSDRVPWNVKIRAKGRPGHGSRMYDGSAVENLMESVEVVSRFRESQFDVVKAGKALNGEVVSVNPVYVKAGVVSEDGFAMNVQPSEAEAGFDLRLTPTTDPEEMRRRIAEEWAPAVRNMSYEIIEKGPLRDYMGRPLMTATDDSNPWWSVFKQAITSVGEKLSRPEILASTTDARYLRQKGIPVLGFSPMKNTPILLHDHNEHLKDTVFMKGIQVYESLISSLSTFTEASH
ncbi:Aminoacylase-1B [Glycine soja]|nr:Aminoacylase-1B [Glycine soja]